MSASHAVVSALFPRQAISATLAANQPATARAVPDIILSSTPADSGIEVAPLDAVPSPAEPVMAARAPAALPEAAPADPEDEIVISTKSVTDIALPQAPEASGGTAPDMAMAEIAMPGRALAAPPMRPAMDEAAQPEAYAALAAADAEARHGATLGFTTPEVALDSMTTAYAAPDMPATRPQPRPEIAAPVLAEAEASFAETIPGIRPQPRPEATRVAALLAQPSAPAATVAEPVPARSGGLFSGGGSRNCGTTLARAMPRRSGGAAGGAAFFAALGNLSGTDRDARVIQELARGNMPNFLRRLEPVTFRGQDARGADAEIVICVTPDYLALGSDSDFVRVPLGLPAAARIAGQFDMTLPTPRMVDAIYAQADVHLSPAPMQAGPQMSSTAYFLRHNATIQGQLGGRGGLVAGQKKDVVMASRMASAPGRVAIYGWHRSGGSPIQPVSTVHGANYADYSHGIRLVSKTAYLNGRPVSLDELLGSSRYASLLNSEGPLPGPVIRTASR
ncbi:hypothetical protein [Sinisalibacter aestuarii]|uniref:hypothetical protein n=1 Tax=Sinisalibacter aestuarii TaxID=2949426 RepID=UPI002492C0DF|nr:hypothetical protein [Sinisalibacter aestuarii]